MKRLYYLLFLISISILAITSCRTKENISESVIINSSSANISNGKITKEMAYDGVNKYCHKMYDWGIAKDDPSIMSVEMGEVTDTEYQVIFKSYTGSFVYFYVDKLSGNTKMVDVVPTLNIEEESGTINIFDYIDN